MVLVRLDLPHLQLAEMVLVLLDLGFHLQLAEMVLGFHHQLAEMVLVRLDLGFRPQLAEMALVRQLVDLELGFSWLC